MTKPDDLQWTAFRYAAGEMSADEAAAFEALMGEEQPAREALARAVELSLAVDIACLTADCLVAPSASAAPRGKEMPARTAWARPLAWMGAGAALCLAAVMAFVAARNDTPDGPQVAAPEDEGRALASAWLDAEGLRAELATLTSFSPDPSVADTFVADAESAESFRDGSLADSEEFTLPAWMLAAVSGDALPDAVEPAQEN